MQTREMKKVPLHTEGVFAGIRNSINNLFFKWFGRGEEIQVPPSLGPGIGEAPRATEGPESEIDYAAAKEF